MLRLPPFDHGRMRTYTRPPAFASRTPPPLRMLYGNPSRRVTPLPYSTLVDRRRRTLEGVASSQHQMELQPRNPETRALDLENICCPLLNRTSCIIFGKAQRPKPTPKLDTLSPNSDQTAETLSKVLSDTFMANSLTSLRTASLLRGRIK